MVLLQRKGDNNRELKNQNLSRGTRSIGQNLDGTEAALKAQEQNDVPKTVTGFFVKGTFFIFVMTFFFFCNGKKTTNFETGTFF